jgi:hypothetical protein
MEGEGAKKISKKTCSPGWCLQLGLKGRPPTGTKETRTDGACRNPFSFDWCLQPRLKLCDVLAI